MKKTMKKNNEESCMLFSVSKVHWWAIKAVQIDSVNRRIVSVACESLTGRVYFLTVAYRATHKTKCCIITRDGNQTMKRFVAWRITVFKKLINTTWTEEKNAMLEKEKHVFSSAVVYISHIYNTVATIIIFSTACDCFMCLIYCYL